MSSNEKFEKPINSFGLNTSLELSRGSSTDASLPPPPLRARRRVLLQAHLSFPSSIASLPPSPLRARRRVLLQTHRASSASSSSSVVCLGSSASRSSPAASRGSSSNSRGSSALFKVVSVEFFSSRITIWTSRVLGVLRYEIGSNLIPFNFSLKQSACYADLRLLQSFRLFSLCIALIHCPETALMFLEFLF